MLKQIVVVVALGFATISQASDWIKLGDNGEKEVYLDRQSIKFTNSSKAHRGVWTKDIMLKKTSLFKKDDRLIAFSTYDCKMRRFLINEITQYDKKGKLIIESKEGLKAGWQDIPPDSLFDGIQQIVCSAKI